MNLVNLGPQGTGSKATPRTDTGLNLYFGILPVLPEHRRPSGIPEILTMTSRGPATMGEVPAATSATREIG